MSTYATAQDVLDRYEGTAPEEKVQRHLDDAETLLPAKVPRLAERVAGGDLDPELVRLVLVWAVLRYLRNPQGFASESDGDYSYSRGAAGAAIGGRVTFLADELSMLREARDTTAIGWGTVRTVLPADRGGHW